MHGQEVKDREVRDVQTQLQGTWQLISGEKGGRSFPENIAKDVQIIFNDDQMTTRNGENEFTFPYKLLQDEPLSSIDLIMNESVGKGIFRLEGIQLTIVHTEAGEPRPTTFATSEGSKLTMLVLEKVPSKISFATVDGGEIVADIYGVGDSAVVLAHGGRFNKESWTRQARELSIAGFQVMAIDFRGYGQSRGPGQEEVLSAPLHLDILAGVSYLRTNGAKIVSVVGASMGGSAAAAAVAEKPNAIDRLVLLGSTPSCPAKDLKCSKLYIMTSDDTSGSGPRLPALLRHFEQVPGPKELMIPSGSSHAQFMFDDTIGHRVMADIIRFLSEPN